MQQGVCMKHKIYILWFLFSGLAFYGLSCSNLSKGVYRIPYANGIRVKVIQDHKTHNPPDRVDLRAVDRTRDNRIVAAAAGRVRFIEDSHSGSCSIPGVTSCSACNNYVWVEHPNGEWTKYSHFVTGSVTNIAGLKVGQQVSTGTFLGLEGDIGATSGSPGRAQVACDHNTQQQSLIDSVNAERVSMGLDSLRAVVHLHFEVAVPDDPSDPISPVGGFIKGKNKIPRICNIPDSTFVKGQFHTAAACLRN